MKNPGFQKTGLALAAALAGVLFAINVFGQTTPPPLTPTPMFNDIPATPASTPVATTTEAAPPPVTPSIPTTAGPYLSPATSQVLQLTQAKVSDTTIIAYVQNSSTMYGLNADQIIYLKQQGVSDGVINAMLNQSSRVGAAIAAQTPQPNYGQGGTPPDQSSTAVVQPTTAAPSSVYVVPDSQTANYNAWASQYSYPYYSYYPYYYYPYYYPYYYWPVTFSFYYGYHGGYYHPWYGGGYWHGGTWGGSGWHGGGGTWNGGSGWHGGTTMGGGGFHSGGGGMGGGFHH